jgi:hypothetical protein
MIDFYPDLPPTIDVRLKSALHEIGFTEWVHLRKSERDGKVRLTWTSPVEGYVDSFLVLLVLENGQLKIDVLRNPLGHSFGKNDVEGLVAYINKILRKVN